MKGGLTSFDSRLFFRGKSIEKRKRRLFLIKESNKLKVYDGSKRAAEICTSLIQGKKYYPVVIYLAIPKLSIFYGFFKMLFSASLQFERYFRSVKEITHNYIK